jgi:hypothetical protein
MKFLTLDRIFLVVAFLIVLFLLKKCEGLKAVEAKATIDSLSLANQQLDSVKNKLEQTIYLQDVIVTNSQAAIEELTDSIFNLKKKHDRKIKEVIAYYKGITNTGVDSIEVPYLDSLAMREFSDSVVKNCSEVIQYLRDSTMKVPRRIAQDDPNFKFIGTVRKNDFLIESISFPDTLQLRFVERKNGLFKRRSIEVQFFHSNPHVITTQSNSVIYKPKKRGRWLEKAILVGAGVAAGVYISK